MFNKIIALLAGIFIGANVTFAIIPGLVDTSVPSPTASPTPIPPEPAPLIDRLSNYRQQLYQEGISVQGTVDTTFPDTGFILEDDIGDRIFVMWTAEPPQPGQLVSVKGTFQRLPRSDRPAIEAKTVEPEES